MILLDFYERLTVVSGLAVLKHPTSTESVHKTAALTSCAIFCSASQTLSESELQTHVWSMFILFLCALARHPNHRVTHPGPEGSWSPVCCYPRDTLTGLHIKSRKNTVCLDSKWQNISFKNIYIKKITTDTQVKAKL